jgi:hypothetical protein
MAPAPPVTAATRVTDVRSQRRGAGL